MIPLMFSMKLVLLFHSPILWLDNRTFFQFRLDRRPLSRLVCHPLFHLVFQMTTLWILNDLLKRTRVHLFLFYPNGLPIQLKLLQRMLEMLLVDERLKVKRKMSEFIWWLVYLKPQTLLPTQILKDNLNGIRPCRHKLILFRRIRLGTWFLDCKERTLWNVDGSTWPNLPLTVSLSDINHA